MNIKKKSLYSILNKIKLLIIIIKLNLLRKEDYKPQVEKLELGEMQGLQGEIQDLLVEVLDLQEEMMKFLKEI